ncbi:MAG: TonB-dependent receptor [Proteobacteria bacterium]|nr:TonB-dependent receptor [Pseudomonadota bacterium]
MHKELLLGSALLVGLASTAHADPEVTALSSSPIYGPETITVTATRTEQPIVLTGASVSVLTAEDLKTQQTMLLTDALKEVPSLVVVRNGGLGQPASISLRGAEAGQTVVLIDGVRVNDASTTDDSAAAALGDLLVNNIDRVEVLRGPQSTLYGSDAIGGIVNIVTKRGGDTLFGLDASAEAGSFGTFHASVAAHGSNNVVEYGAGLSFLTTAGTPAADVRNGNPENDGYTNFGATANVRVHLNDWLSADLRGYYTQGHDDFDDGFGGPPLYTVADSAANNTNELKVGYLGLNADLFGGRLHNRIALIGTEQGRIFYDSASDITHLNYQYFSSAARFEYQGTFDVDDATQIVFGAETQFSTFRNDNFGTFAFFSPPVIGGHDRLTGYYLQGQTTLFEALTLTGGVRLDDDDQFGTHTSYKINAAYQLFPWNTVLRANIGTGFKAPSLFQEFGPNSNPIDTLKPETATGWEAGFDTDLFDSPVRFSATYFDRTTSNQIAFQNCYTPADAPGCPSRVAVFGYYLNFDKTRGNGIELEVKAPIGDTLEASLQYTNMTSVNELSHLDLPRRPHDLASALVTWRPLDGTVLGFSVTYQGKRFNDAGNFTPLTSNTTVNLFGSYDLSDQWQLFGRIDNLFNDRTEEVTGYGVPGTGAFAGIRAAL